MQAKEERDSGKPGVVGEGVQGYRQHLRGVAYRMLGSVAEADDAVQEAWLRISLPVGRERGDQPARVVDDGRQPDLLGPPPRTDVTPRGAPRRSRAGSRRDLPGARSRSRRGAGGRRDAGPARGPGCPEPARTAGLVLARRVRRSVRRDRRDHRPTPGTATRPWPPSAPARPGHPTTVADRATQRRVLDAFTTAAQRGDFDALLELLDPDVTLRADLGSAGPSGVVGGRHPRGLRRSVSPPVSTRCSSWSTEQSGCFRFGVDASRRCSAL